MNNQKTIQIIGLIAGSITVVLYFAAYLINKKLFLDSKVLYIASWAIYLIAMRQGSIAARNEYFQSNNPQEGYTFAQAFRPPLLVFVVAQIIFASFQFIMMKFVDPELPELMKSISLDKINEGANLLGKFLSEEELEKMIEKIESEDFTPKIGSTLLNLAYSILGGAIVSVIFALIYSKKPSQF